MWDLFLLTIFKLTRQIWDSHGIVVVTIACAGALSLMALARQAKDGAQRTRLGFIPLPGVLRPGSAIALSYLPNAPHASSRSLPPSRRSTPPLLPSDPQNRDTYTSSLVTYSSALDLARDRDLSFSMSGTPRDTTGEPVGDNATVSVIAPPIWRRVESLIEEHRAATTAHTGEAFGAAALIEPGAPIWRAVSALRSEVAQRKDAPEPIGQEAAWEFSSQLPIWGRGETHGYAGPHVALTTLSALNAEHEDSDSDNLSRITTAPPIWTSWLSGAWSEAHALPTSDEIADTGESPLRSDLPIWRTMRQP